MAERLSARRLPSHGATLPGYAAARHAEGIVHIGLGAFHRAHQAVYTDDALAARGGDWRIVGVSLRSQEASESLTPQDGLYTLLESDAEDRSVRVIGAISRALSHAHGDSEAVLESLVAPQTRVVSLTVTEKAYGFDRATGGCDPAHPAIAHDLESPDRPTSVAGLLVHALARRRAQGTAPFTVLCCDNLPDNGRMVRDLVLDFADRTDSSLCGCIEREVAFPASMVDRITPASDAELHAHVREVTGLEDHAAVHAERFRQWVIEDRFPNGRPAWEAGGALFVSEVAPYERMKLRMLNGSHSMLAYTGFLCGLRHVRDVMADRDLGALVRRHLHTAAATLDPVAGIEFDRYADDLVRRFQNPHLAHETRQIAMDGTEKLPQRLFEPALDTLDRDGDVAALAFAYAAWLRYCLGRHDNGTRHDVLDPRADEIAARLSDVTDAESVYERLSTLPGYLPDRLATDARWRRAVLAPLSVMLDEGMRSAVRRECATMSPTGRAERAD